MCRQKSEAAKARAHRSLSTSPRRSKGTDGRFARRVEGSAERRQDSPHRIVRSIARTGGARAQDCADRDRAEPLQHHGPKMGQHPLILRKRKDWLHAMGAGWWHQRNDQRRLGKSREGSRNNHLSARAGVAVASIPSNAADSGHVIARAPGRKYGGTENTAYRRRVEDN